MFQVLLYAFGMGFGMITGFKLGEAIIEAPAGAVGTALRRRKIQKTFEVLISRGQYAVAMEYVLNKLDQETIVKNNILFTNLQLIIAETKWWKRLLRKLGLRKPLQIQQRDLRIKW